MNNFKPSQKRTDVTKVACDICDVFVIIVYVPITYFC